jgi:hypothetical protein
MAGLSAHVPVCKQHEDRYQNGDFHFYRSEPIPCHLIRLRLHPRLPSEAELIEIPLSCHAVANLFVYPSWYLNFRLVHKLKQVNV